MRWCCAHLNYLLDFLIFSVSSLSRRTIMRAIFVLPDVVLRQIICVYVIIIVIDLVNEPRLIGHRKSVGVFILSIDKWAYKPLFYIYRLWWLFFIAKDKYKQYGLFQVRIFVFCVIYRLSLIEKIKQKRPSCIKRFNFLLFYGLFF